MIQFIYLFWVGGDWVLDESLLLKEAEGESPHKIDENMWKNREHMEEIIFLLHESRCPLPVSLRFFSYIFFYTSSLHYLTLSVM